MTRPATSITVLTRLAVLALALQAAACAHLAAPADDATTAGPAADEAPIGMRQIFARSPPAACGPTT